MPVGEKMPAKALRALPWGIAAAAVLGAVTLLRLRARGGSGGGKRGPVLHPDDYALLRALAEGIAAAAREPGGEGQPERMRAAVLAAPGPCQWCRLQAEILKDFPAAAWCPVKRDDALLHLA